MSHKNFSGKFGEIWAKIFCTPKIFLSPTPMVKYVKRVARDWNSTFINVVKCILERYAFTPSDFGVSGFDPFLQLQTRGQLTPTTKRQIWHG